jgi:2',3'-cyclic-nucleotide 2'-phosphodiesterase (5'-nucleotidase family)
VSNQLGGLAKKASYLKQHQGEIDGALVVDAGDLLTPVGPGMLKGVTSPADIATRAAMLAKLESQIGLNAVAVGERDLALGLKELRKLAKDHGLRLLAANLVDQAGKPAFEAGFVTEAAGAKVGIFGLTDVPDAQRAPITQAGLTQQPTAEAATREVARLRAAGATLIVALAHVGVPAARDLLKNVKGIDLCIVGHTSNAIAAPERVGDGYLVEAMRQGKQLGEFLVHLLPGDGPFANHGERRALGEQLAASNREYDRLARQVAREPNEKRRSLFLARLEAVRTDLTRTCTKLKETPREVTGRWLEHRLVPMDRSLPDDPVIGPIVKAHVEEMVKASAARGPLRPPTTVKPPPLKTIPKPPAAITKTGAPKAPGTVH